MRAARQYLAEREQARREVGQEAYAAGVKRAHASELKQLGSDGTTWVGTQPRPGPAAHKAASDARRAALEEFDKKNPELRPDDWSPKVKIRK